MTKYTETVIEREDGGANIAGLTESPSGYPVPYAFSLNKKEYKVYKQNKEREKNPPKRYRKVIEARWNSPVEKGSYCSQRFHTFKELYDWINSNWMDVRLVALKEEVKDET